MNMFFRIKLDINNLVNEMIDKIPEEIFISDKTTFLDPAFGGGQFLVAIAMKLHKYGHDIDNIKSRLFGYEDRSSYLSHAKNIKTCKIAQLSVVNYEDYISMETKKRFDVIVGNPPFSKGNKGKGGTSIYQEFSEKSMELADIVAFVTPGSFDEGYKFTKMRRLMNEKGIIDIKSIDLSVFGTANIIRPTYWIVGDNNKTKTVEEWFSTPEKELFKKLIADTESFIVKSGRGDVSTSDTPNLSVEKTDNHVNRYVDRVKKDGPMVVYCNDKINMKIDTPLMVFAQRGGKFPKMFYIDDAVSYSQNVIAIQVENEKQFNNLKELLQTDLYVFLLMQLAGGKVTTKAGFPSAFTKGKIEKLPAVNLNKSWTNDDVYKYFSVTDEEKTLIQDQID